MLGVPMRQIDLTQAFTNADIKEDVYMSIPQGWRLDVANNKLVQDDDPRYRDHEPMIRYTLSRTSTVRTVQGARNWYLCLKEALLSPPLRFPSIQHRPMSIYPR